MKNSVAKGSVKVVSGERKGQRLVVLNRPDMGDETPCTGEVHSNPHMDGCTVCLANRWGWVRRMGRVSLRATLESGEVVRVADLTDEQYEVASESSAFEFLSVEERRKGIVASFFVVAARRAA